MLPNLELVNRTVFWTTATSRHPPEGTETAPEGRFVVMSGTQPSAAQEAVNGICCWCWAHYASVDPFVAHRGGRSTKPEYWQGAGMVFG